MPPLWCGVAAGREEKGGLIMNIYYLRKFRREARRIYRACWDEDFYGGDTWRIRVKKPNDLPFYVGSICYSEEDVLEMLKKFRKEYILSKAREIRHNRIYKKKYRKHNKQLTKY